MAGNGIGLLQRGSENWYTLREEMPLLDVMSGQDRLKLDRIDTDLVLSPEANRYLLLVLNTGRSALTLTGVNAINAPAQPESEHISGGRGERLSESEAVWRWKHPQPLSAIAFMLNDDGVLPAEIAAGADKDRWHTLKKR